ncbi:predicted protein [Arabidopsis lyrata subsp. lyrata]|uniref:Predicted protein n=1 Tax=Arabidopsis lyrata subsp. lyrata TaxID=81972 RepID=D7KB52_ARALL|nr:predicted protein [Arabidopsis lyrata subsp. lyrata]
MTLTTLYLSLINFECPLFIMQTGPWSRYRAMLFHRIIQNGLNLGLVPSEEQSPERISCLFVLLHAITDTARGSVVYFPSLASCTNSLSLSSLDETTGPDSIDTLLLYRKTEKACWKRVESES